MTFNAIALNYPLTEIKNPVTLCIDNDVAVLGKVRLRARAIGG